MNIKGHSRRYESLNSTNGADRVQRGGVVVCACGWSASARDRKHGAQLHDGHKYDVSIGLYAEQVEAEKERRLAVFDALLADDSNFSTRGVTREQVQGWKDALLSGKTRVSVR